MKILLEILKMVRCLLYIPPKQLMEQCQNSFRERKKLEEEKRKKKEERKKRDIANINSNC